MNIKPVKQFLGQNSPIILTALGIGGMVTSTVLAVRATPKATYMIQDEWGFEEHNPTNLEKAQLVWKLYVPSVVIGASSIACIIGGQSLSLKRNAALASLYALSETTMKAYSEKVVEKLGARKEREIRDDIKKGELEALGAPQSVVITGKGDVLCCDTYSGQYFRGDAEKIRQTVNDLNHQLLKQDFISVNDLLYELGCNPMKDGNEIGWKSGDGLIDIYFSGQLSEQNEPCLVLDYNVVPKYV